MALNVTDFRAMFPAFADETEYPDAMVSGFFALAECWLGHYLDGCPCNDQIYYLLTAHLLYTRGIINSGAITGGRVQSSNVGGVSVSMNQVLMKSAWQEWLAGSPYGIELWAFLRMQAGGGRYVGGSRERFGYRKAGGGFSPLRRG